MIADKTLNMINVVKDKKGKYVFYNNRKKIGYYIPEKKLSLFFWLTYRYIILFSVAFIMYSLNIQIIVIFPLFIVSILFLEWFYKIKVLKSFKKIENYQMNLPSQFSKPTKKTVITKAILYLVLAILLVVLAVDKYSGESIQTLFFLGALASLFLGFVSIKSK